METDSLGSHSVTVSRGTASALEEEAADGEVDITTVVGRLVSDYLKTSVDEDVETDITVDEGVELTYELPTRQETMIEAISDDADIEGFVTAALETQTESVTESLTIELPGTIIAVLDTLVDSGRYPSRSAALQDAVLDDGGQLTDSSLGATVGSVPTDE